LSGVLRFEKESQLNIQFKEKFSLKVSRRMDQSKSLFKGSYCISIHCKMQCFKENAQQIILILWNLHTLDHSLLNNEKHKFWINPIDKSELIHFKRNTDLMDETRQFSFVWLCQCLVVEGRARDWLEDNWTHCRESSWDHKKSRRRQTKWQMNKLHDRVGFFFEIRMF
jgi:hypothetical protein